MKGRRKEMYMKRKGSCENLRPTVSRQPSGQNDLFNNLKNNPKLLHLTNDSQPHELTDVSPPRPLSPVSTETNDKIQQSVSNESSRSSTSLTKYHKPRQQFELSKLPTPRLALLTGNRKLISRLGQMPAAGYLDPEGDSTPYCYLLKQPVTLRELTLESTEDMNGHILVCMHHKVSNIFKFIYNLR